TPFSPPLLSSDNNPPSTPPNDATIPPSESPFPVISTNKLPNGPSGLPPSGVGGESLLELVIGNPKTVDKQITIRTMRK
ncbi:1339_t:CDS:1, partial [Ambispora gerdemannii]